MRSLETATCISLWCSATTRREVGRPTAMSRVACCTLRRAPTVLLRASVAPRTPLLASRTLATHSGFGALRCGSLPLARGLSTEAAPSSSSDADAAPTSPKVEALVNEIASLTLLEAAELTEALKVCTHAHPQLP